MDAELHARLLERGAEDGGVRAVVLAGGRGTRLAPFTSVLPKPLMPIGDRAILEIVVDQLVDHGFSDITLCVGYLAHLIRAVFDYRNGDSPTSIRYLYEAEPLGTAGPLRGIQTGTDSFLAMNGDVLTTMDFSDLLEHHRRNGNILTIATHERTVKIDYGVLYVNGADAGEHHVEAYEEKPELASTVSMGVYAVAPEALEYIPNGYFDIPDLVHALLADRQRVGAYSYEGLWFDIGRKDDYEQAVTSWEANVNGNAHYDHERFPGP